LMDTFPESDIRVAGHHCQDLCVRKNLCARCVHQASHRINIEFQRVVKSTFALPPCRHGRRASVVDYGKIANFRRSRHSSESAMRASEDGMSPFQNH
jgi:hypothetical protein